MVDQSKPSQLKYAINEHYRQLGIIESKANKNMAAAYQRTVATLVPKLEAALIAQAANPDDLNKRFVSQRLASLTRQATEEWGKYGAAAGAEITEAQRAAALKGSSLSAELIGESFKAGPATLATGYDYLPKDALKEIVGALGDGSPLRTLSSQVAGNMAREMNRLLITGITTGVNPRVTARLMNKAFDAERSRLETIARTETLRAFREGSRKNMLNNKDVVKGWKWYSRRDRRTCAACFAMHGTEFELKTMMATHPNCRCTMLPVTKTWEELGFRNIPEPKNPAFAVSSTDMLKADGALCRAALGRGGCFGFTEGLIPLDKFVQNTYSPQWGYGRTKASLQSIVGPANGRALTRGIVPPGLAPIKPTIPKSPLAGTAPPLPIPPPVTAVRPGTFSAPLNAPAPPPLPAATASTQTPISAALRLDVSPTRSKYGKDLQAALDALDRVHTDGVLQRIPLNNVDAKSFLGQYSHWEAGPKAGQPVQIKMARSGDHRSMTLWHEIGHFLDNQALGGKPKQGFGFSSAQPLARQSPEWVEYHRAIAESETIKGIQQGIDYGYYFDENGNKLRTNMVYAKYIAQPHEVFARAYSQYVAEESGELADLAQEQAHRTARPGNPHATVWPSDEFAPIRAAIDAIIRKEGWK